MSSEKEGEELQFDTAEMDGSGAACAACTQAISGSYYEINGKTTCARCREGILAAMTGGSGLVRLLLAGVFGLAAAAAGTAVYYGVAAATGYEVGLVAIVVGLLVGKAVNAGSAHRGGLPYQSLAVVLTYCSIVSAYTLLAINHFEEQAAASASALPIPGESDEELPGGAAVQLVSTDADASAPAAPPASQQAPLAELPQSSLIERLLGRAFLFVLIFPLAFAAPVMDGLGNILGLLIIGFGLYQAASMNRKVVLQFSGPFTLGSAPEASSGA
jgi:hypothetical protein